MPAILALLGALAPLLPSLEGQIVNIIQLIQGNGHVDPAIEAQINALMVQVHTEVQAELAKRLAP